MAYATTTALSAEISARKAGDLAEATARDKAIAAAVALEASARDAAIKAAIAALTPAPPPAPTIVDLAEALLDATPGGIVDLGGQTFTGAFVCAKEIGVTNGRLITPPDAYALTMKADGEVSKLDISGAYIAVAVAAGVAVKVHDNALHDLVWAAVETFGALDTEVYANVISRVINLRPADDFNAYGIAFSHANGSTVMSQRCIAHDNDISGIPAWHALDTHGGIDCQFVGNRVSGVRRPIFLTEGAQRTIVRGNTLIAPTAAEQILPPALLAAGCPASWGIDIDAITTSGGSASFFDNIGQGWPVGRWYAPQGGTTILASSGNSPSVP